MSIKNFLLILLFLSLFFESNLFPFSFVVAFSIFLYILYPEKLVVISIFLASLALDAINANTVGITPLFIFLVLFLLEVLKNVFVVKDARILLGFVIFFSYIYAKFYMFGSQVILYAALFAILVFLYVITKKILLGPKIKIW